jgi:endonuclease/exonuclease/phosphatase family metal-dependent hydrolase
MRIISLNIWGGHEWGALLSFVHGRKDDTDIFCFQETWDSTESSQEGSSEGRIYAALRAALPSHEALFFPIADRGALQRFPSDVVLGLSVFVRKGITIEGTNVHLVSEIEGAMNHDCLGYGFAHIHVKKEGMDLDIITVHGMSQPGDKLDTPIRLAQSQLILDFISTLQGPTVLLGDFNLMPGTESIAMIERTMENLISKFDIKDTRGSVNHAQYPKDDQQYFADFAFVSKGIVVNDFTVPDLPLSDHLPLIMDISLQ